MHNELYDAALQNLTEEIKITQDQFMSNLAKRNFLGSYESYIRLGQLFEQRDRLINLHCY